MKAEMAGPWVAVMTRAGRSVHAAKRLLTGNVLVGYRTQCGRPLGAKTFPICAWDAVDEDWILCGSCHNGMRV